MKTIEEKALAYDKALEKARIWKEKSGMPSNKQGILDDIFPELKEKESEDEKIRKGLLKMFHHYVKNNVELIEYGLEKDKVIAWLEKQGEQKSADKVERKFKVGDIIRQDITNTNCKVLSVNSESYYLTNMTTGDNLELFNADTYFHLWTIEDAKDGDILTDNGTPFIFKCTKPSDIKTEIKNPLTVLGYCGIGGAGFTKSEGWGDTANCRYYPSTKEQRDILFTKMKEAGYIWDSNEKKLMKKVGSKFHEGEWCIDKSGGTVFMITKVLQNVYYYITIWGNKYSCTHYSLENDARLWTIGDAKEGDVLVSDSEERIFLYNGKQDLRHRPCAYCGIYKTYHEGYRFTECAVGNCFANKETHPATKEQRDILFAEMLKAGYEWDADKKELKKVEQKSDWWSEEGENYIDSLVSNIKEIKSIDWNIYVSWLKSLKDRVQPKQEWSEDDKKMLDSIIFDFGIGRQSTMSQDNWLKFLRPSHWKPSETELRTLYGYYLMCQGQP